MRKDIDGWFTNGANGYFNSRMVDAFSYVCKYVCIYIYIIVYIYMYILVQ